MLRKGTCEQCCWSKPSKNDIVWSVLFFEMRHWPLNVTHSSLFLKHTAERGKISRKSYSPLKCLFKTRLHVKVTHLVARFMNVHWRKELWSTMN